MALKLLDWTGKASLYPQLYQSCSVFFFFQAEDGIRDLTVTGVQTCALPILPLAAWAAGTSAGWVESASFLKLRELSVALTAPATWAGRLGAASMTFTLAGRKIGRASCRERV